MTAQYGGMPKIRDWIVATLRRSGMRPGTSSYRSTSTGRRSSSIDSCSATDDPARSTRPFRRTDEPRKTGVDFQFNGSLFVYLHGNNCSTHAPTGYGFPTFFYPANVLAKMGPEYLPRADGTNFAGAIVPASEHLEVKSMNCISNALLAAFCHWDGGQLATDEVLDFVTDSPRTGDRALGNRQGCGTQVGTEDPPTTAASMTGGRCAPLSLASTPRTTRARSSPSPTAR